MIPQVMGSSWSHGIQPGMEPVWDSFFLSLCPSLLLKCTCMFSLSKKFFLKKKLSLYVNHSIQTLMTNHIWNITLCLSTWNCKKDLIYSSVHSMSFYKITWGKPQQQQQKPNTHTKHVVCALQKQHPHTSVGTDIGEAWNMHMWVMDFPFSPLLFVLRGNRKYLLFKMLYKFES